MRTIITNALTGVVLFFALHVNAQSLNFTVNPGGTICQYHNSTTWGQAGITSNPGGVTHYSWSVATSTMCSGSTFSTSPNGTLTNLQLPCAAIYTITAHAYNGSTLVASASQTLQILPGSTPTITGVNSICTASSVTLTANGANSYTWLPGNITSTAIVVSPTATSFYTVLSQSSNGCYGQDAHTITVQSQPTISAFSPSLTCGNTATMWASGASNYTWLPQNTNNWSSTVSNLPSGINCFTAIGSNSCGSDTTVLCINIHQTPSLSISGNSATCAGQSLTLTATGANSYSWSGGLGTNTTVVLTPTSPGNFNYMLYGSNGNCHALLPFTVSVATIPATVTSPGSLCPGNVFTLSTVPAQSFTWSNSSGTLGSAQTITVAPLVPTNYTVLANVNGCVSQGTASIALFLPTVGIAGASTVCAGGNVNLSVSSFSPGLPGNYTWYPGANTGFSITVSPTASACYTVVRTAGSCTAQAVHCVSVFSLPVVNVNPVINACAGQSITLATSGSANNWLVGSPGGFSMVAHPNVSAAIVPAATGIFTVLAFHNLNACVSQITNTVTAHPNPTLSISGPSGFCPGDAITLISSGASTYSWSTGANSPSITVAPVAATCYTIYGSNSFGCTAQAAKCVTIHPLPSVTISGNTSLCQGLASTLTASGASSFVWSNLVSGAVNVVSPSAYTCYTVTGTNQQGCTDTAVTCVNVLNTVLGVSGATVCKGSSHTFTVSGANTYSWTNGPQTSTYNVLPTASANYTVSGTGSNGCVGSAVASLVVDTTCSDAWPGDANSDGMVNSSDILEIGLAFSATGSARNPGGNNYIAQFCNNWSGTVSSGKNKCHADCDGSGTINHNDTVAIYNNFSQSHSFRLSSCGAESDIRLLGDENHFVAGEWNKVNVMLGDDSDLSLYGLVFDLHFDQQLIESGQVYLVYNSSFLNAGSQNVIFRKQDFGAGRLYAASIRTDKQDVNGKGKIAELHFRLKQNTEGKNMQLSATNSFRTNKNGIKLPLNGENTITPILAKGVGVAEHNATGGLRLVPNPADEKVRISSGNDKTVHFTLTDISGRVLQAGSFESSFEINTKSLAVGIYMINCISQGGSHTERLIIQR